MQLPAGLLSRWSDWGSGRFGLVVGMDPFALDGGVGHCSDVGMDLVARG